MITSEEKAQLDQYSRNDPVLESLLCRLREQHQLELSRISHEIRNPVTLINSYLQLTEKRYPQVKTFTTWVPLMENMEFLKNLLEDISRYHHASSLTLQEINLPEFLRNLARDASCALHPVSVSFSQLTPAPRAAGDPVKLREAILNLIRNGAEAVGHTPHGAIRICLSFAENTFQISVSNNGPLIPPDQLEKIFEPFISYKKDGTGLGLSIVRSIMQAHQGSVSVTSVPEETVFTLRFPLALNLSEAACARDVPEESPAEFRQ